MNIPKYVIDIMSRTTIDNDHYHLSGSNPGYTIKIRKSTPYTQIATFRKELDKLVKWATKQYAEAYILDIPTDTHHVNQVALVVITDPVMLTLEKLLTNH